MNPLSSYFVELTKDAALKAFWRKSTLKSFLKQNGISSTELSTWDTTSEKTKAQYLQELFYKLIQQPNNDGYRVIFEMAKSLSEMKHFPDLESKEDTKLKVEEAKKAIFRLKQAYDELIESNRHKKDVQARREEAAKNREKAIQEMKTLETLKSSLEKIVPEIGTQAGGYAFEKWFYELAIFFDIDTSQPYTDSHGRQIDGSITFDGNTYLIETKFLKDCTKTTDVDIFLSKIGRKADNTMGIIISRHLTN